MTDKIVTFEERGNVTIAALTFSEITHDVSEQLQAEVQAKLSGRTGVSLVLDLTALTFLGSVGLTALVILLKRVREANGRMMIVGLTGPRLRVMELTRMTRIFELHPDLAGALAALEKPEQQ